MSEGSTIFALSSGHGRAGIAVIRVSGPRALSLLQAMAPPIPLPRRAVFRLLRAHATGEVLDQALVLSFPAPSSETGEDVVEFQVHGSPAVIKAVLTDMAAQPGCRMAEPGEFARRAFENGKLDLTAIEGLADLIDAETESQRRQAVSQLGGAFAQACDGWRERLLEARALAEATIDFSDEADVAADAMAAARRVAEPVLREIIQTLDGAHRGEIIREGFRIVLAGPPNVGKSSLMNALARRDVAIVSSEAGTTRDVLEVRLDLGGYAAVVTDTAGLRNDQHVGEVEREGMRRARERACEADLVIWLVDAEQPEWHPPANLAPADTQTMVVLNKIDIRPDLRSPPDVEEPIRLSAKTGGGIGDLETRLAKAIATRMGAGAGHDLAMPTQLRHRQALEDCRASLSRVFGLDRPEAELAAEDLRLAADALGRITGRIDPEEVLGAIFGRFCIGK